MADINKKIKIAKIATAHGIKGMVKLDFYGDDISIFEKIEYFFDNKGNKFSFKIKNPIKNQWVAEVNNITDRNDAEKLRGTEIYIDRSDFPEIKDENEFYYEDLIGMNVLDKDGNISGKITAIQNFGAGDLLEIKPVSGASYYIPFTEEYVPEIDLSSGKIVILPDDAFL